MAKTPNDPKTTPDTINLAPDVLGLIRFLKTMYAEGHQAKARRCLLSGWRLRGVDVDPVLTGEMSITQAVANFDGVQE